MKRIFQTLLLAAALLFAQHAAMLHGLAHAQHEIAAQEGKALGHGAEVCSAYGAFANALTGFVALSTGHSMAGEALDPALSPAPASTRVVFDSRAPPLSA